MSIQICVYRNRTSTCRKEDELETLKNIPQLPWAHKDEYNCCQVVKWKTQPSLTQIVPSNSRPVPMHRVWRAPVRPMPPLSANLACNEQGNPDCDIDLYNTPLTTVPSMNPEEYLSYSNPTEVRDADGIWRRSFYNGPGWVTSRVHGKSKSRALPRPIKHWRKQLFPRQKLNLVDGEPMYPMHPPLATDPSLNNTYGGRSGRLSILDRPGGAITLDPSSVLQQYYAGNLNTTSCVSLYFPTAVGNTACDQLRNTTACFNSITHARPGHKVTFNKYSFSSSKMYLQSRARLHYQQSTIQFNPIAKLPVLGWQGVRIPPARLPPSSVSLYLRDSSGCFAVRDCSCAVPVAFKPRNATYAIDCAVNSGTDIRRRRRATITRNQYNVTNKWGMRDGADTIKHWPLQQYRRRGHRKALCCDQPEFANHYPVPPEPSWDGCYTIDSGTWTVSPTLHYTGFNIVPDKFLVGNITPELLEGRTVLAALFEYLSASSKEYIFTVKTNVLIWYTTPYPTWILTVESAGVTSAPAIASAGSVGPIGTPATISAQSLTVADTSVYPAFESIVDISLNPNLYTLCITPWGVHCYIRI